MRSWSKHKAMRCLPFGVVPLPLFPGEPTLTAGMSKVGADSAKDDAMRRDATRRLAVAP